jgi:hypothetical protein
VGSFVLLWEVSFCCGKFRFVVALGSHRIINCHCYSLSSLIYVWFTICYQYQ